MAGNKLNTKSKGREDKVKSNKSVSTANEECEDVIDFTLLRKPIPTSVTGLAQARKIFDVATEELKELLSNECDILYECKVCRNIFRSLANFISHKRVYCKEKFNTTEHGHFIKNLCTESEICQINRTESGYQEFLKVKDNPKMTDEENDDDRRVPLSKDLTAVYEKIMRTKSVYAKKETPQVTLQKIPSSNVAVFQNVDYEQKDKDNMRSEMTELDSILSRDMAVLQSDGKFVIESSKESEQLKDKEFENIIQISDDEDVEDVETLRCKICDIQFSTLKTLKFHMKSIHHESRLVYPCPDCLEIFSTSWSVYRHLFKVHRKTAAQIRRLRESIQAKAFRMNNPPAYYEKRKNNMKSLPNQNQKITDEERLDQENQAWMDNLEGDGEVPRCGGCGRTFERRAALAAHTHTCQPRSRALAGARKHDNGSKRIEIQIRKDYNKAEPMGLTIARPPGFKIPIEDTKKRDKEIQAEDVDEQPMDYEEDCNSTDNAESSDKAKEVQPLVELDVVKPIVRLPHALQAEKSNLAAFRQKIQPDVDISQLLCKKCDTRHTSTLELYEHMAAHYKWVRYACKLCNFKDYNFEKLPDHVKVVHKLKGDSDFYYSTVKAVEGTEAMIFSSLTAESESNDETNDPSEPSPASRRPSRCSSDSSRLSDDSSSSSNLKEAATRKRKPHHLKVTAKKKRNDNGDDSKDGNSMSVAKALKAIILGENNSCLTLKNIEENSSDMDDEDKLKGQTETTSSFSSRRPVRKRTKVINEDFEYDLSNLLKKDSQGYKDTQTIAPFKINTNTTAATKTIQNSTPNKPNSTQSPKNSSINKTPKTTSSTTTPKQNQAMTAVKSSQQVAITKLVQATYSKTLNKKKDPDDHEYYVKANKECCGALQLLSQKSVESASASSSLHFRNNHVVALIKDHTSTTFVKPMVPRYGTRGEKMSPKKITTVESDSNTSKAVQNLNKSHDLEINKRLNKDQNSEDGTNIHNDPVIRQSNDVEIKNEIVTPDNDQNNSSLEQNSTGDVKKSESNFPDSSKRKYRLPVNFRRQSIEVIKNPLINKNITDFSKAGMKTKILVIKPINRNIDKNRSNTPLKFQTIKLKGTSKKSLGEDNVSDQVMVVKVPKVPCTSVSSDHNTDKVLPARDIENKNTANEVSSIEETSIDKPDVDKLTKVISKNDDIDSICCNERSVECDDNDKIKNDQEENLKTKMINNEVTNMCSGSKQIESENIEINNHDVKAKCENGDVVSNIPELQCDDVMLTQEITQEKVAEIT